MAYKHMKTQSTSPAINREILKPQLGTTHTKIIIIIKKSDNNNKYW